MTIQNPRHFDYLQVIEFERGVNSLKNNHRKYYPLTCVDRSSVKESYSDNANYTLTFDVQDDGSEGFKALHEGSWVLAGEQLFVIQDYTKKVAGNASASITGTQIVNAYFQRVLKSTPMKSNTEDGDDTGTSNSSKIVYTDLHGLLQWFWDGIDTLGFHWSIHGHFPKRPIKDVRHWNGKQLLTHVVETWPGTVIIPWQGVLHFYGYQKERDQNGDLQNVRNIDTNLRFDQFYDTANIEITHRMSGLCNAIEVRSATYSTQPSSEDGDTEEENQFVQQQQPYFKNFLATSKKSIQKYGLWNSPDILDGGFTRADAALQAAREKMVLEPQVTVKAVVDHPGQTEEQPIPGYKYSIGVGAQNELYHVILRAFEWYPFDPAKGATLTLNNVDPGLVYNIRATTVHDMELSPTITNIKMLQDDQTADDLDTSEDKPEDGDYTGTGSTGLAQMDSDQGTARPDDPGDSRVNATKPIKACLPISDRGTNANIDEKANVTVNRNNKALTGYVTKNGKDGLLANLRDGRPINPNDRQLLYKIDYKFSDDFMNQSYYKNADYYFGQTCLSHTGGLVTTADRFVFRDHVEDSDYKNGVLNFKWHDKKHGTGQWIDLGSDEQPGRLAHVTVGTLYGNTHARSQLSKKENVKRLSKQDGLELVNQVDIGGYNFKDDEEKEYYVSPMIDDVHRVSQWNTPKELISKDGKHRKDGNLVAYNTLAIQALSDKLNKLTDRLDDLEKENKKLKDQLKKKS